MSESTYNEPRDADRLRAQQDRVRQFMADGSWHTLSQVADGCSCPEASASARIRHLRKEGYEVERRYVCRGLHEYRLVVGQLSVLAV